MCFATAIQILSVYECVSKEHTFHIYNFLLYKVTDWG